MKYTKAQLVAAMEKWNKQVLENPEAFTNDVTNAESVERFSLEQMEHLLSLVEPEPEPELKDKSPRVFTENEISRLQSKVYEITGKGEVMMLFNEMLGISAG